MLLMPLLSAARTVGLLMGELAYGRPRPAATRSWPSRRSWQRHPAPRTHIRLTDQAVVQHYQPSSPGGDLDIPQIDADVKHGGHQGVSQHVRVHPRQADTRVGGEVTQPPESSAPVRAHATPVKQERGSDAVASGAVTARGSGTSTTSPPLPRPAAPRGGAPHRGRRCRRRRSRRCAGQAVRAGRPARSRERCPTRRCAARAPSGSRTRRDPHLQLESRPPPLPRGALDEGILRPVFLGERPAP